MPTIPREQAKLPLVLSLDIGSSSIRTMIFDAAGDDLAGLAARTIYPLELTDDGGVTAGIDTILESVFSALDDVLAAAGPLAGQIAAVAACSLVGNVLGVDAEGRPTSPVYFWADTRPAADTADLRRRIDGAAWHQRTGTVIHTSYLPARFLWLARTAPDLLARTAYWMSLGEYLYWRLFGTRACSLSVASWSGLLNRTTLTWDAETLALLPIREAQLSPLIDVDAPLHGLTGAFAARWPALAGIPWLPVVGDGATANLGSGCTTADQIAVTVGTSGALRVVVTDPIPTVPPGLWVYRVDRRRALLGGALSNGGNLFDWMRRNLNLAYLTDLEGEIARQPPDGHGLTVLPFLAGERSPGWAPDAVATITGLRLATTAPEILRAGLEAVAYRFALIFAGLQPQVPATRYFIASGAGLLHSPSWMQIMADVLGMPVIASGEPEASSRGNALLALEVLGAIPGAQTLAGGVSATYTPDAAH
ncbi:MAG TPA: gluconokinase, partial [Chloroflexia bacterium]|nr:gluconokinase [Chloroflexia bacterium]